ncbi:hypothetical protein, partial [Lactococcus nasutitermitis]
ILKGNFASVAGNWKQASTNDIIHISSSPVSYGSGTDKVLSSITLDHPIPGGNIHNGFTSGIVDAAGDHYTSSYSTVAKSDDTYYVSGILSDSYNGVGRWPAFSVIFIPKGIVGVPGSDISKDRIVTSYLANPDTRLSTTTSTAVWYKQ